jgi:hypothetical protein
MCDEFPDKFVDEFVACKNVRVTSRLSIAFARTP